MTIPLVNPAYSGRLLHFRPRAHYKQACSTVELNSSEGESETELTAERMGTFRAARGKEALNSVQFRPRGSSVEEVVCEVRLVGEVESLEHELQITAFTDFDVLRNAGIHLEEPVASHGVVADLVTEARRQARLSRRRLAGAAERQQVCWVIVEHDQRPGIPAANAQNIVAFVQVIRTRTAELHDGRDLKAPRQQSSATDADVVTLISRRWSEITRIPWIARIVGVVAIVGCGSAKAIATAARIHSPTVGT